jgi:hypothetical protein
MDVVGTSIGIAGLALLFFHVGKDAFKLLSTMKDMVGDAKLVKTLVKVERQR